MPESKLSYLISPGGRLGGTLLLPGDKSISHRAVMLASIAEGVTEIEGFLEGEDSLATLAAFRAMGIAIEGPKQGRVTVHGAGMEGLQAPAAAIDLGNSGTSMRLLAGLLSGREFETVLTGDASLSRRPMRRVTEPLALMGARIDTSEDGTPPLRIHRGAVLHGIDYELPVASAQVKSALLLAGLNAHGTTCVREPAPTRDHTERMLQAFGVPVGIDGNRICIAGNGPSRLTATPISIPADISSAAFFLVGASIAPDSQLLLTRVGINPTRTGVLEILRRMGADIEIGNQRMLGGEPVADLRVRSSLLHGIEIPEQQVPLAIDEFPALFIAAACAAGTTVLRGAGELRVKESDRIQVMADGLQALGIDARPTADGMVIEGGDMHGGIVDSHGDHRIAMSFAIAGLRADAPIEVRDCANVTTSFPGYLELARGAGLDIREIKN